MPKEVHETWSCEKYKKYEILTFTRQVQTEELRETVDNLNIM